MGWIDIIKPLSTVQGSAVNKSQKHQEKKILGRLRIKPGAAGCETRGLALCYAAPPDIVYPQTVKY